MTRVPAVVRPKRPDAILPTLAKLVLSLSGYNKLAWCAPTDGPLHPLSPRNRSLRAWQCRSCVRLQDHRSLSSLYQFAPADCHSIDLCSPFARSDRQRSGRCRKTAPSLSSLLPASRRSPRSRLWRRLGRLPLGSRWRPCPHCPRSEHAPVFARILVRRPNRSASLLRRAVPRLCRVDAVFRRCCVLLSSLFSGLRLCQRLLNAAFPLGHSRIFFRALIHASSRRLIF